MADTHLTPRCRPRDRGGQLTNFFLLPDGRPIQKWGNLIRLLERTIGVPIPCTKDSQHGSDQARGQSWVARQLNHGAGVAKKYYTAISGTSDASHSFRVMEGLRKDASARKAGLFS